jgi:riboflavin kinase/FMN adenylyltransferase
MEVNMEVIYSKDRDFNIKSPTGIGLGNFDGLHVGHMALINTLTSESRLNRYDSLLYTFTKHPENILRKKLFTPLLTTVNKKIQLLNETPLKYLYLEEFDENYSHMKPENFVKDILVDKLKARLVVAGFNYRFGYNGHGDVNLLAEIGKHYNIKVIVIPPIKIDNSIVSSTLIREHVSKGNMEKVFKLLGRHYSITGEVLSGRRIGNTMGFPTANIRPENYLALPARGVYVTRTLLDGKLYNSITNIGRNPTFKDGGGISVETHIFDFDRDIYGRHIEVFFLSRLRGEKRFKDKEALAEQIGKDVRKATEYLEGNKA